MDTLLKDIQEHFAAKQVGLRPLKNLPNDSKAFTIRSSEYFGVGIPFDSKIDVFESSANSRIFTANLLVDSSSKKFLILSCYDDQYRNSFAILCVHFVDPNERKELLTSPYNWWLKWIGLLGDTKLNEQCYSTIAEMLALDVLYRKDKSIVWASSHEGSHDIECDTMSYEVKSTIHKTQTVITVSSQHQLYSEKKLDLLFCRLEESVSGFSINDLKLLLVDHGYDEALLEKQIEHAGFSKGATIRNKKYKVLETRQFHIDADFPKITKDSFAGGQFPKCITKIVYDIDLEGLPYTNWLDTNNY